VTGSPGVHQFRSHPWHGLDGSEPADVLNADIEITPFDLTKYYHDNFAL
jgi:hypothetical protein